MSEATTTTLTIELPAAMGEQLETLARATERTKTWLAREALQSFLDLYDWHIQAVRKGVADADAGKLVDHEEVTSWLESWGSKDERPAPRCG